MCVSDTQRAKYYQVTCLFFTTDVCYVVLILYLHVRLTCLTSSTSLYTSTSTSTVSVYLLVMILCYHRRSSTNSTNIKYGADL